MWREWKRSQELRRDKRAPERKGVTLSQKISISLWDRSILLWLSLCHPLGNFALTSHWAIRYSKETWLCILLSLPYITSYLFLSPFSRVTLLSQSPSWTHIHWARHNNWIPISPTHWGNSFQFLLLYWITSIIWHCWPLTSLPVLHDQVSAGHHLSVCCLSLSFSNLSHLSVPVHLLLVIHSLWHLEIIHWDQ